MATRSSRRNRSLVLTLVGAAALTAACTSARPELGKTYPDQDIVARDLNIHVFREVNHLRFTNTSDAEFGPATVWVNAAYSYPIAGLALGQRLDLPLGEFRNQYGQAFRAGGFFATELPSHVVKAEIADDRGRFELIVVRDELE